MLNHSTLKQCPDCGLMKCREDFHSERMMINGVRFYLCSECASLAKERFIQRKIDKGSRRFWERVDQTGGPDSCWPWIGTIHPNGYGVVKVVTATGKQQFRTHRLALILSGIDIPDGHLACHRCDNPICCNTKHLFVGLPYENTHDGMAKGRIKQAMTPKQIADAKARYIPRKVSYAKLAAEYGVGETTVRDAIKGYTWKHLYDSN